MRFGKTNASCDHALLDEIQKLGYKQGILTRPRTLEPHPRLGISDGEAQETGGQP